MKVQWIELYKDTHCLRIGLFSLWIDIIPEKTRLSWSDISKAPTHVVSYDYEDSNQKHEQIIATDLQDAKRQAVQIFRKWLEAPLRELEMLEQLAQYAKETACDCGFVLIVEKLIEGKEAEAKRLRGKE